jgi:hypothetical protein
MDTTLTLTRATRALVRPVDGGHFPTREKNVSLVAVTRVVGGAGTVRTATVEVPYYRLFHVYAVAEGATGQPTHRSPTAGYLRAAPLDMEPPFVEPRVDGDTPVPDWNEPFNISSLTHEADPHFPGVANTVRGSAWAADQQQLYNNNTTSFRSTVYMMAWCVRFVSAEAGQVMFVRMGPLQCDLEVKASADPEVEAELRVVVTANDDRAPTDGIENPEYTLDLDAPLSDQYVMFVLDSGNSEFAPPEPRLNVFTASGFRETSFYE